jgi:hypothetical protein
MIATRQTSGSDFQRFVSQSKFSEAGKRRTIQSFLKFLQSEGIDVSAIEDVDLHAEVI